MNSSDELIHYLKEVNSELSNLSLEVSQRNKTKKFKAISNILLCLRNQADATLRYARAGGYKDFSVVTQKSIYKPIIEWISSEVGQ